MNHRNRDQFRISDEEVELLVTGSPVAPDDHADLKWFLGQLSDVPAPPRDVDHMATALASIARSSHPSQRIQPRRAVRRMTALAASVGLLFAMTGIALAADGASPGDLLYGVDQAFEQIGIGDGGVEERLEEFEELVARGEEEEAYEFLEEYIDIASEGDASQAEAHLGDRRAEVAEENTSEHLQFIEDNQKQGVGADGKEFGQGVAERAGNSDKDLPDQPRENQPPDHANNDKPDTDKETGPSDETGPPADPPEQSNSTGGGQSGDPDNSGHNKPDPPSNQGDSGSAGGGNGNAGSDKEKANSGS